MPTSHMQGQCTSLKLWHTDSCQTYWNELAKSLEMTKLWSFSLTMSYAILLNMPFAMPDIGSYNSFAKRFNTGSKL